MQVIKNIVDTGGLSQSVALILEELASMPDASVQAVEGASSLCPAAECGSAFGATGSGATVLVLICIILAVAAALVIRAGRRRSL